MRRTLVLVFLALGTVFGFTAGVQSWRYHREHGWGSHFGMHESRVDRLAEACLRAAERAAGGAAPRANVVPAATQP